MSTNTTNLINFVFDIANKLRGPYRPPQYRKVMLPMTVLRRLDCVLEPTKEQVLAEYEKLKAKGLEGDALHKVLGRLPDGWFVKPLKYVTEVNPEVLSEATDPGWRMAYADISSVSLGQGIVQAEALSFVDAPSRAKRRVRAGDTLVSTVWTAMRRSSGV
jgi:hypothetical protein